MALIPVYVVRRLPPGGEPEILSAWGDIYAAKFEAQRWEQDSKVPHDFVDGHLLIGLAPGTMVWTSQGEPCEEGA